MERKYYMLLPPFAFALQSNNVANEEKPYVQWDSTSVWISEALLATFFHFLFNYNSSLTVIFFTLLII